MKQKSNVQYWDKSFLDEVESTTISEGVLLWALSGAAFALRTPEAMLYLDPFLGGDPVEGLPGMYRTTAVGLDPAGIKLADAVLISHEHYDHCHEDTLLSLAAGTRAKFYGPFPAVKEMLSYGISSDRIRVIAPGDVITVNDAMIEVWPGYDAGSEGAVTFTIESGGVRVMFGGDSSDGPAFSELGAKGDLDIAMLAFGRTWYMSEAEMLDAAERLRPRLLLPFHWEIWRGHTGDALELGRLVERKKPPFEVGLLLIGDYLHYLPDGSFIKGR
ncbi:MAG: MBL fold metallo-hydrolase [Armatimonadota bacterium]